MPLIGRKYPTPILKPALPFFLAGGVIYYGIWKLQAVMLESPEYKDDPRNPNRKSNGH